MRKKTTIYYTAALICISALLVALVLGQAVAAEKTVRLSYVEWSETVAATNMVKTVIQEKLGYDCEIVPMTADKMWEAVDTGKVDGMVALQTAAISTGLPFAIVMFFMCFSVIKGLVDHVKEHGYN